MKGDSNIVWNRYIKRGKMNIASTIPTAPRTNPAIAIPFFSCTMVPTMPQTNAVTGK